MPVKTIKWEQGQVLLVDQTRLPLECVYDAPQTAQDMWEAIRALKVRGAPAIGIAAAFGVYLAARTSKAQSVAELMHDVDVAVKYLASARPTAVNLSWALGQVQQFIHSRAGATDPGSAGVSVLQELLLAKALNMIADDNAVCLSIGTLGLELLHPGIGILTHCNAGGLGTAQWGTALAPIYLAQEKGWQPRIFADETRPVLQGSRLTAWELQQAGVDTTLICDNMAGVVMRHGWVQAVIVGTDRVAANGDVVNKIGTYSLAILAHQHRIPFYVAAPRSSIDLGSASGNDVVIEERSADEVVAGFGQRTAPEGIKVYNPAFDVTPADLVTAIITEVGIVRPPYPKALHQAMRAPFQPTEEVRRRMATT